jgi:hypothetical protein
MDASDNTTVVGTKPTATVAGIVFTGKTVGVYEANVSIKPAANLVTDQFDITVELVGFPELTKKLLNVPKVISTTVAATLSSKLVYVTFAAGTIAMATTGGQTAELNTGTVTGGSYDISAIVDADYVGDSTAGTGIHSFDSENFDYICLPHKAIPALDTALINYVDTRQDCQAVLRTPVGADGTAIVDYREGTGTYTHAAHNTWRGRMFTGGLNINHPVTGVETEISEVGDVLGVLAVKDNKFKAWLAAAGRKRGKIRNCNGVVYDLGTAGRSTQADLVDIHGVNMVINHQTFGTVVWGNSTLQKEDTLLKHANVADLIMFIQKVSKPIIDLELFDPNDMDTWKTVYRGIKDMMDEIKRQRGCWNWIFQGDQDASTVEECVVNTGANIDAGQWLFNLWVQPKVGMKYVGMRVVVTNSNVKFEELLGQPV